MSTHFLTDVFEARYDALRDVYTDDLRLFLLGPAPSTGSEDVPIDFGPGVLGEVLTGWRVDRRRFDRDRQALPLEVLVACESPYEPELLRTVTAFALVVEGNSTGDLYRCVASGVVSVSSEAAYRFAGNRKADDWEVPGAVGGGLVTGGGGELGWG